jgi:hypothetical protein
MHASFMLHASEREASQGTCTVPERRPLLASSGLNFICLCFFTTAVEYP